MPPTLRTTFLVDGFNVYHSCLAASQDLGGTGTRWLDLKALLTSYLPVLGPDARLESIYYFSALALHRDARRPGHSTRHREYIECLTATGVKAVLGRFKRKEVWCHKCRVNNLHHEEKETDVAISIALLELFHEDASDIAVLVTGDTDLAPAVRAAARLFPTKQVCFAFPYRRMNEELRKLVSTSFRIRKEQYAKYQLPSPFTLPSGRQMVKPSHW